MSSTHVTPKTSTAPREPADARCHLIIPFTVLAALGLALFFSGGGQDGEPTTRGLVGAAVLCLSMPLLIGFASWLAGSTRPLVRVGAGVLALGGLTHLVENLVLLTAGRGGQDEAPGAWDVVNFLSPLAFAILGLGALLIAVSLHAPGWLRGWGAVAGVSGLVSGLSSWVAALGFLPPVFNLLLLGWLITLGVQRRR